MTYPYEAKATLIDPEGGRHSFEAAGATSEEAIRQLRAVVGFMAPWAVDVEITVSHRPDPS